MKSFNDLRKLIQENEPTPELMAQIADGLITLRTIHNVTVEQFAEKSGVSADVIQAIEAGKILPTLHDLTLMDNATMLQVKFTDDDGQEIAEPITTWTIGSDANGDVQLNLFIGDKRYTLDVHEKDVQSMQTTLNVKRILAKTRAPGQP